MAWHTRITERFALTLPIIQAPMAGGSDTPALVAAVAEAGGLGFLGAAYSTPAQIGELCAAVRSLTPRPFGINLFAPTPPAPPPRRADVAAQRLAPYFAELGLPAPQPPAMPAAVFDDQVTAARAGGAAAFSFTFGNLPAETIAALKTTMFVIGTATTVDEAVLLERSGVDAVVAQGSEAGGHRGTFNGAAADALIGTMALVPQVVDAVRLPVVASGGIMDGRGIAAALALGASAVQMGTAFLTCAEAGTPPAYRDALLQAHEDDTRVTRAFSGRAARGLVNRFMQEVEGDGDPDAILPFPLQNVMTRPLRQAAARAGRSEFLSLWSGQGIRMARVLPAGELMARLGRETEAAARSLVQGLA